MAVRASRSAARAWLPRNVVDGVDLRTFSHTGKVDGRGGSYGPERLEVGRRRTAGGPPEIEVLDSPGPDLSWQAALQEFTSAICEGREPLANAFRCLFSLCDGMIGQRRADRAGTCEE